MALYCYRKTLWSRSLKPADGREKDDTHLARGEPRRCRLAWNSTGCTTVTVRESAGLHFKSRGRARQPIAAPALWPGSRAGARAAAAQGEQQLGSICFQAPSGAYRAQGAWLGCRSPRAFQSIPGSSSSPRAVPTPLPFDLGLREVVAGYRGICVALEEVSEGYAGTFLVPSLPLFFAILEGQVQPFCTVRPWDCN